MKIKLICAAAAAVIAVSSAVVATAYGNSASDNEAAGTAAKASSDIQEAEDVELTAKDEKQAKMRRKTLPPFPMKMLLMRTLPLVIKLPRSRKAAAIPLLKPSMPLTAK